MLWPEILPAFLISSSQSMIVDLEVGLEIRLSCHVIHFVGVLEFLKYWSLVVVD